MTFYEIKEAFIQINRYLKMFKHVFFKRSYKLKKL